MKRTVPATLLALLLAPITCPVAAQPAAVPGTAAPVPKSDEAFQAWSAPYIEQARRMLPAKWELETDIADEYGLRLTFVGPGVAAPAEPDGGPARIKLIITPKTFGHYSRLGPGLKGGPIGRLGQRRTHPAPWIGCTADANFYQQSRSQHVQWLSFAPDCRRAFGIETRHSTLADGLFAELRYGIAGVQSETLFQGIADQEEAVKLRLARALAKELRLSDAPFVVLDMALSGLTNQSLYSHATRGPLINGTMFPPSLDIQNRRSSEVAGVWDRWITWAEGKTEEQWMEQALQNHMAQLRGGKAQEFDRVLSSTRRLYVHLLPAQDNQPMEVTAAVASTVRWYTLNKARIVWNRKLQQFDLREIAR